jgi:hypothetical protein
LDADGALIAPAHLSLGTAVRYLQLMPDPPLVAGGPIPPTPQPPPPAAPAKLADALSTMEPEEILASHASFSHGDDRMPPVGPVLLIGAGDTPGGDPYELAAFAGEAHGADRAGIGGVSVGSCVSIDYPQLDEPEGFDTGCWGDGSQADLHVSGASGRKMLAPSPTWSSAARRLRRWPMWR